MNVEDMFKHVGIDADAEYWHVENNTEVRGNKGFLVCDTKECEFSSYDHKRVASLISSSPSMYLALCEIAYGDLAKRYGEGVMRSIAIKAIEEVDKSIELNQLGTW